MDKYSGKVIFFSKGFGFISWEKGGVPQKDMFVHYSDIVAEGYKTLSKDQKVKFGVGTNHHGDPKAVEVEVVK